MAVFAPTSGFSSRTSCWHSFSASGSFVKVLLQNKLSSDRVDRLLFHAAQPALRFHRREALVDSRDWQTKTSFEAPREFFHLFRERMLARFADRQSDDQLLRVPLLHQGMNLVEAGDRVERMRRLQLGLPDCNSNTLETEVEGEDGALVRHAPPNPAAARSRGRAAP